MPGMLLYDTSVSYDTMRFCVLFIYLLLCTMCHCMTLGMAQYGVYFVYLFIRAVTRRESAIEHKSVLAKPISRKTKCIGLLEFRVSRTTAVVKRASVTPPLGW